jgi:hypothetical protein
MHNLDFLKPQWLRIELFRQLPFEYFFEMLEYQIVLCDFQRPKPAVIVKLIMLDLPTLSVYVFVRHIKLPKSFVIENLNERI